MLMLLLFMVACDGLAALARLTGWPPEVALYVHRWPDDIFWGVVVVFGAVALFAAGGEASYGSTVKWSRRNRP